MRKFFIMVMCLSLLTIGVNAFAADEGELYPSRDYVSLEEVWVTNAHTSKEISNNPGHLFGDIHAKVHAPGIKKGSVTVYYEIIVDVFWINRSHDRKYSGSRSASGYIKVDINNGWGEGSTEFDVNLRRSDKICYGVAGDRKVTELSKYVRVVKFN